jgi:hypothetical protein
MAARHLVQQAVRGIELSGVPILDRAQQFWAISGGYVATTWTTELDQRVNRRTR